MLVRTTQKVFYDTRLVPAGSVLRLRNPGDFFAGAMVPLDGADAGVPAVNDAPAAASEPASAPAAAPGPVPVPADVAPPVASELAEATRVASSESSIPAPRRRSTAALRG